MAFEYTLGAGVAFLLMGIAFHWGRVKFIKKGSIALATVFKLEEKLDNENNQYYIPYFKFTSHNNNEIIYEHRPTNWKAQWSIGEKIKVAYKEDFFGEHEILLLSFLHTFGLSMLLSTVGLILLIAAGGIYLNISGETLSWFIPGSIVSYISILNVWFQRFFNSLK